MYKSIRELQNKVNQALTKKKYENALYQIQSFVEQIVYLPETAGRIISSPEADQLCLAVGREVFAQYPVENNQHSVSKDLIVYIATKLYVSGGHTAVIEDLIRYQPHKKHLIIITDIFNISNRKAVEERFRDFRVEFLWAPRGNRVNKLLWLRQTLLRLQPEKTYLFNHHQDVVAIAAMQPALVPDLYFFHHADYQLCLGIHIPHAQHIDAQPLGFHNCRYRNGINHNIYWPLVVPDQGQRPAHLPFMADAKITTCSSGSPLKFESPYLYSYAELIPQVLKVTQGKHIHIGRLSKNYLEKIKQGLREKNIAAEQFVYIPWVKSVWQTVIEQRIDIYFNSFPISGGRATIEILGSGTPIIMHENYRSEYLGQVYLAHSDVFYWSKPQELLNYLQQVTPQQLQQQSQWARTHYEKYYSPAFLAAELAKSGKTEGLQPAQLPPYRGNELQSFLERHQSLNIKNFLKKQILAFTFIHPVMTTLARYTREKWKERNYR